MSEYFPNATTTNDNLSVKVNPSETAVACYQELSQAEMEKVELWLLRPLLEMEEHDGFACLALCFPLIERTVRALVSDGDTLSFSEGGALVKRLKFELRLPDEGVAHDFWQVFRNGLNHRAMPKCYERWTYELTGESPAPIEVRGNCFIVNPWKIRELVIELVRGNPGIWSDTAYPLARVFRRTS